MSNKVLVGDKEVSNNILVIDKELIDREREILGLKKPIEFEEGRITPELVEQLMQLVKLPFDESAIEEGSVQGYSSKGVPYTLQLARVQEIFGTTHVKIEHEIKDYEVVQKEEKEDMHYYKVYVAVKIGNYTLYTDMNNKPDTSFVPYYIVNGIGRSGNTNKGTAEKNAVANGLKDCFKQMGMLRYLYLEEDNEGEEFEVNQETTQVGLLENPTILPSGKLFFTCKAKDINKDNKEIKLIVYRDSNSNKKEHKKMIDMITKHKDSIIKGKILKISYIESSYKGNTQYIINKIHEKQKIDN